MKNLLIISLTLNVVLVILLFQEMNQPPLERIIMETKGKGEGEAETPQDEKVFKPQSGQENKEKKANKPIPTVFESDSTIVVQDEQSFIQASEEIEIAQNKFLEDLEMSEDYLRKKQKITEEYYLRANKIYSKRIKDPSVELSFQEQHKLIELQEKVQKDYKKLFGDSRWEQYKKWVDDYNKNLIKNHKSKEFSPLLMSY